MCLRGTIQLKWSNEISSRVSLVECHALQESNGMPRRAGVRTLYLETANNLRRFWQERLRLQCIADCTASQWVDKDYLNQLYNKGVDFFKERSPSLPSTTSFELLCRFLVFSLGSWHIQPPTAAIAVIPYWSYVWLSILNCCYSCNSSCGKEILLSLSLTSYLQQRISSFLQKDTRDRNKYPLLRIDDRILLIIEHLLDLMDVSTDFESTLQYARKNKIPVS